MIQVLLWEEHPVLRESLRRTLADAPGITLAGEAESSAQVFQLLRQARGGPGTDVLLMDVAAPYREGLDLLHQLRQEFPRLPLLMLSNYPDKQFAVRSLKLGAAGYLGKAADSTQMEAALRCVAAGGLYLTPEVGRQLDSALALHGRRPLRERLSAGELRVFRLLTAGRTVAEIAAQLGQDPRDVGACRAYLWTLAGVRNDVELTLYAVREELAGTLA